MIGNITLCMRNLVRRPFLLVALVGTFLVALFLVSYGIFYWRARAELDAAIANARAQGEPVWFSDLNPGPDRNPSKDAVQLLELCEQIVLWDDDDGIREKVVHRAVIDVKYPSASAGLTSEDYDQLQGIAEANADVLRAIQEIARRGDCWFEHDYDTVSPLLETVPHLDAIIRAEFATTLDVIVAMRSNEEDQFLASLQGYFDLAEINSNEPSLFSPYSSVVSTDIGVSLIAKWSNVAVWSNEAAGELEQRLVRIERSLRVAPKLFPYRSRWLTTLANLDNQDNQTMVGYLYSAPWYPLKWLEDKLPGETEQRQAKRWSSLAYRPWIFKQQASVIENVRRQVKWMDEPGPSATGEMAAIEDSVAQGTSRMPISEGVISLATYYRRFETMELRQRLINASILLRLCQTYEDGEDPSERLSDDIAAALETAPVGYFSGKPLLYDVKQSTVTLYDVEPEHGTRVGAFRLRFFDTPSDSAENAEE